MKNQLFKRILSVLLAVALLAGYYVPGVQAESAGVSWKESDQEVSIDLSDRLVESHVGQAHDPADIVRVSIVLEDKPTVQAGFSTRNIAQNAQAMTYSRNLQAKQETLAQTISTQALGGEPLDVVWNLTLVGNVISANIPYGKITAISRVKGVKGVFMEQSYEPCVVEREEAAAQPQMFSSLGMVGSSRVWSTGYTGAGSRIAVIDTGTDIRHQSLDNGAFLYALEQNAANKGMAFNDYVKGLDLLDEAEIASVLTDLNIYERLGYVTASDLYLNEKLAFGANYVDRNLTIDHLSDYQGEHGSHVAGIATANRYIPTNGAYAAALDTVLVAGMAPDAQLITMKVFGGSSPYESDYMSAIEDAILLGCDAVNLSLGTSAPGDGFNDYYADLLDYMTTTDTVVVASAGNSYNWATASTFGYLYSDDVSFDTVGAPGSHRNFFTVASVENDGSISSAFRVAGRNMFYGEVIGYGNAALATLDTSTDVTGTEYDYVFIDGVGYTEDYAGMNLEGKIVFCSRGDLSFSEKANNAMALGAAAVVVYNNGNGGIFGMDPSGLVYDSPCVSLSQEDANVIRAASATQTTASGQIYFSGKMTVLGVPVGTNNNSEFYTMSNYSSWGVPGNLTLKPEITAPGGNIYSIYGETPYGGGGDQYEFMSGTSMAAPAVTGMVALLAQYLEENGLAEQEGLRARTLAQSLLMSTAVPLREEAAGGTYYSLLNQGAGLGRVDLAAAADSYILVDGQSDGKVKAELGDDPDRTGVYEFTFSINNLSGEEEYYALSADVFCQAVFSYESGSDLFFLDTWTTELPAAVNFSVDGVPLVTQEDLDSYDLNGDGTTDSADADYLLEYLVGNETALHGDGDVSGDEIVNSYDAHVLLAMLRSGSSLVKVPAGGSATVDVRIVLPESTKQHLDETYPNGTYVEAFVYAESVSDEEGLAGTAHSIPVLGFYGNWSDPSMFDHGTYVEYESGYYDRAPYLQAVIGCGNTLSIDYGDGNEYYFGGNPVAYDESYMPERNAINNATSSLVAQYYTLIRAASMVEMEISDLETGDIYYKSIYYANYPAYYHVNMGSWQEVQQYVNLNWNGRDAADNPLPDGTHVQVSLLAIPEYYRNEDGTHNYENLGKGVYLSTPITIDNTAPEMLEMNLVDRTLTVTAQDNQYVAAVALMTASGNTMLMAASPNQVVENAVVNVELDLSSVMGQEFLLAVYDYASNVNVYEVTLDLPEIERPLLTVADAYTDTYYGMSRDGMMLELAWCDRGNIHAAEFVDGYVFEVCDGDQLYVGSDDNLHNFRYLADLDPDNRYGISTFLDLAYNYADGKLYGLFYCTANYAATSFLCTIDMLTGTMEVICEMPVDANTLAIDDEGNFYSMIYGLPRLYTYTLDDLAAGNAKYVGETGAYSTTSASSMAWDHDADTLYWGFPNTLLEIDPATAAPTELHYNIFQMVGLYIVPETYGNRFAPVNTVSHMTISQSEGRTLVGSTVELDAQVWPWNVSDGSVTWSSSNSSVAAVDQNGIVTGIAEGSATITATSNLDPAKSVSCDFTVETLGKTMNAVIWDEYGGVWWSRFNTDKLPEYTRVAEAEGDLPFVATAYAGDTLYAATLDISTGTSDVYTVDPETFELSLVGPSSIAYVDLAFGPGTGCLFAPYFNYIVMVDLETGDYVGAWDWSEGVSSDIVGMTYYGSEYNYNYEAYMDYFLILDSDGNVYLEAFLVSPSTAGYFNGPAEGFVAHIGNAVNYSYFQGFHYDGEYTYWARFDDSINKVELLAWDCDNSGAVHCLGSFPEGVWPVGGLYEDSPWSNYSLQLNGSAKKELRTETMQTNIAVYETVWENERSVHTASAGLNAVSGQVIAVPNSAGEFNRDDNQVMVALTPGVEQDGSTNGRMTVTYDPSKLKLVGVNGTTTAFAYAAEDGSVNVAFADDHALPGDTAVAYLTFEVLETGEHTVSVLHTENGDSSCSKEEVLSINCGCVHSYNHVVTPPTCTDQGYTTHTCAFCGHSYVDTYVKELGHDMGDWVESKPATCTEPGEERSDCSRCDHFETRESPELGHDMGDWVESKPATCTEPGEERKDCSRCDHFETREIPEKGHEYGDWYVVSEASWKGSGEERRDCIRCDHHETRELKLVNPFTDVSENRYYYKPIMWAYYSGITSGKTATTFEPNATCTRAQVMTFLWAAAGRPDPSSLENPFTDVSESAYYYKAVLWAVEKGITSGTSATTFSPNASCTRNQVVTFLWVNAGRPEPTIENPFTDVEEGKYYYKPILWAYENGITTGKTPTTFEPHSPCTRGQIMTFLFQALAEK